MIIACLLLILVALIIFIWILNDRKYKNSQSVSDSYDSWTKDKLLETLWGEHIHLGYYNESLKNQDFKQAKIQFVHELVYWSGLYKLPKGSNIIDIGCGIGGSSRILADHYGFNVLGITISKEQVKRANQLTSSECTCSFKEMNALNLDFSDGTFDGVWSVEAGAHIKDKQVFADEMLRVLRPGGVLAVADWNRRNDKHLNNEFWDNFVMTQLLHQWSHPEFSSIEGFKNNLLNSRYSVGKVDIADWTKFTIPSWNDSIFEGIRRPKVWLKLGPLSLIQGLREIPTILLMRWAFAKGLMRFGVFRARG